MAEEPPRGPAAAPALGDGVPTPEFPEAVFRPVRDLLVRLTRAERTRVISAF